MIDAHENHVKDILEELYGCSGLIGTLIFNLNQPDDDDPVVLASQISLIGTMNQFLRKF
jgi:hypothetical protein